MKKELDWKGVGQFVAFLVSVFAIIRDTFKKMEIGIEIIPWFTGDGKKIFERFLQSLGEEWLNQQKVVMAVVVHMIDCDADPYCPNNWRVVEHKKIGQFKWDLSRIWFYLSDFQINSRRIKGNKLHKELKGQPVLNANVLDYLLAHPELIPEEWKGKSIFFWGTIYRSSNNILVVRYLSWDGDGWSWYYCWLGYDFRSGDPAVLRAS
jgi:hypothetical protein